MVKVKTLLLAGCTLLLSAIPFAGANAAAPMGLAGTVGGEYGSVDIGGGDADSWGVNGEAAFGLGTAGTFGAQLNGGYHNLSGDGGDADIFDIGGSGFWASMAARAGGTIAYKSIDVGTVDISATAFGGFGEYYFSNFFTLGGHAGFWTGEAAGFDDDGFYVGARGTGYVTPNLALSGTLDFLGGSGDATTWGVDAEWQFSQTTPLALYGGYRNTSFDGGGDVDAFFIGIRFYAGGMPQPLVGNHRNGTLGWLGDPLRGLQF
jgi:hypothetical protein